MPLHVTALEQRPRERPREYGLQSISRATLAAVAADARRGERPLPTLPHCEQQVLPSGRRPAHQLRRVSQSARSGADLGRVLRREVPRLPSIEVRRESGRTHCFTGTARRARLPDRQGELRRLPHAEDRPARRALPIHGPLHSRGPAGRRVPELKGSEFYGLSFELKPKNSTLKPHSVPNSEPRAITASAVWSGRS